MSGASLFPEDYPDAQRSDRPKSCCVDLIAPDAIEPRVWSFIHALCHSRTPFTLPTFAAIACCDDRTARIAISEAKQRDWLHVVWPEPYMTDPIEQWVGCLPRRR